MRDLSTLGGNYSYAIGVNNSHQVIGGASPVNPREKGYSFLWKNGKKHGFLLGEGYGVLKKDTFRIANFPALRKKEIARLMKFLSLYQKK